MNQLYCIEKSLSRIDGKHWNQHKIDIHEESKSITSLERMLHKEKIGTTDQKEIFVYNYRVISHPDNVTKIYRSGLRRIKGSLYLGKDIRIKKTSLSLSNRSQRWIVISCSIRIEMRYPKEEDIWSTGMLYLIDGWNVWWRTSQNKIRQHRYWWRW